ncbi:MAG: condensation domain-containing protein [Cyanobacteria bacterium P01_G01_bin.39]
MVNTFNDPNIVDFIQDLRTQGIELWAEEDKLRYRGPKETLTPQVFSQIKQYKSEILDVLRQDANSSKPYPLSLGQQALWFFYQLEPESSVYNMMYAVRLNPDLDVSILEQAFNKMVERHPSLRTAYKTENGQFVQQTCQDWQAQFIVTETDDTSQDYLDNWLAENADRPFNLGEGEIIRAHLLNRYSETDFSVEREKILLLVGHHIAMDLWSIDILMDELCLLCKSMKESSAISLPTLNFQYRDYVHREQKKLAAGTEINQHWDYWRHKLSGELPVLNLPTDKPRPARQTYNSDKQHCILSQEVSREIRELAKKTGTTTYAIVLAAFQVLLLRYTSQEELLIGCPMSGRTDPKLENIIGYFVNPVVLRVNLAGDPTFEELLHQVRQALLEALDHQEFPFPLLVEKLQLERDPSRPPLFQAMLVWDQSRVSENKSLENARKEIVLDYMALERRGGDFDLILTFLDNGKYLQGSMTYNIDLFESDTITRMLKNFQTLITDIVANPAKCISRLSLLTSSDKEELIGNFNDPLDGIAFAKNEVC